MHCLLVMSKQCCVVTDSAFSLDHVDVINKQFIGSVSLILFLA